MEPIDSVEQKQALAGLAELLGSYYHSLLEHGFDKKQAAMLVAAYQTSVTAGAAAIQGSDES